jgi:hypothetical protein
MTANWHANQGIDDCLLSAVGSGTPGGLVTIFPTFRSPLRGAKRTGFLTVCTTAYTVCSYVLISSL